MMKRMRLDRTRLTAVGLALWMICGAGSALALGLEQESKRLERAKDELRALFGRSRTH